MPVGRQSSNPTVFTVPPPQPSEKKPGQLSDEQLTQFYKEGYVLLPEFFSKEELQIVIEAVNSLVDQLADDLLNAGKIKDKHQDASFYERLALLEKEFPGTAVLLHKQRVMPKAFQDLWSNEHLLNVVEQMIGPDISGHPVWNLRTKTPKNAQVTVPWHQDNAYMSAESDDVLIPTAWIPLIDAKKINGCMQVVKGGHKKGYLAKHVCCAGPTWYVELDEKEMENSLDVKTEEDVVLCEVPFGGVLFINNLIPHRSLENYSDKIRWSVDLRWMVPDKPNGFYGLKDNVLLRTSKDPHYKPDLIKFASLDRTEIQNNASLSWHKDDANDRFTPIIMGPWMNNWEIVHHNKHTEAFMAQGEQPENWTKA